MKTTSLRHTVLAIALGLALASTARAGTETLALTGQAAPDAGGGTFSVFSSPVLNDSGQTTFIANVTGGASTQGIYRSSSTLTAIALQGQKATDAAGNGTGGTFDSFGNVLRLNDVGQTAFLATITGGASRRGIYRSDRGNTLTAVALLGQPATGAGSSTFLSLFTPVLNNAGQTAFLAGITGGTSNQGLYRSNSGSTLTAIALQGQAATGISSGTFSRFSDLVLNDAGQTAFLAGITGGASNQGLYRSDSGSALTAIALQGQSATGADSGTFVGFARPELNDAGQTAFYADITGGSSRGGIYRSDSGNTLTAIALQGQAAAGTVSGTFSLFSDPLLNGRGQVAFSASIIGGTSTRGIYRSSSDSTLTAIALQGQTAAGTGGGIFSNLLIGTLNDGGQIAFLADITSGTSTQGLYVGDGIDTLAVQLQGATLAGKTVSSVRMDSGGFNSKGQVAYAASFIDGSRGNFLFTPELHWRSATGGIWENSANWTLGVNPTDVHDVAIAPATSLGITGPTSAVTLKSLQVGTGTGVVTLQMAGGSIDAADPIVIGQRGLLTGTGSFSRLVINEGTVQADRLVMSAKLSNAALLRGVAGGPRFDAGLHADLLNQATGRVLVQPGETLQLRGANHRNLGVFEINQGRLEVAGTLLNGGGGVIDLNRSTTMADGAWTNAAGARLLLGDARLTVSRGLTNAGQVLVTSGDSDVFGAMTNQKAGQIILSGQGSTTFYDAVELQAGSELRTSAGATAVFFGAVAQRSGALLTGTGHKYFEGGFSVGNSPGLGEDGGNVAFGLGNVYLAEIGGTVLGTGYDHYRVAGTLTLGGTLQIVSWAGFTGQAGQSFDLFDGGTLQGQFSQIDSSGLQLAAGTSLDVSRLYTDGVISVTAVPEPASWALIAAGMGLLAWRRRQPRD